MIYEINHIWTAEMKWKWRNDHRSEHNLCNCVKKPEKKIQYFNGVWTHDPAISVRCSINWAMKSLTLGAGFIVSGFIAQLVEHRTGIARSPIQTLLKSWIFFQASLRNCINCVHCHDHFFIFIITHLLLTWVQAHAVTQDRKRVGNEVSTPLFKWCVMQSRTGTSALSVLLVRSKVGELNFPFLCKPIWSQTTASHLFALVSSPNLHLPCCHMWDVCEYAIRHMPVQPPQCTLSTDINFVAWQTINHVVHYAGKKSYDVNMPLGCCNCGRWTDIGTCAANVWANLTNFLTVFSLTCTLKKAALLKCQLRLFWTASILQFSN